MFIGDALADEEAQSAAALILASRDEGLKEVLSDVLGHSQAVVLDGDPKDL